MRISPFSFALLPVSLHLWCVLVSHLEHFTSCHPDLFFSSSTPTPPKPPSKLTKRRINAGPVYFECIRVAAPTGR